jgi:hypothetical protein
LSTDASFGFAFAVCVADDGQFVDTGSYQAVSISTYRDADGSVVSFYFLSFSEPTGIFHVLTEAGVYMPQ